MPVSTEAPLQLPSETKDRVQLVAVLLTLRQGELVTRSAARAPSQKWHVASFALRDEGELAELNGYL